MGLDMYLVGEKYFWHSFKGPERHEDGQRVKSVRLDLGYWRKHPDLHGYIVREFADGVDECQQIHLSVENMEQIIRAVQNMELPHTEGFFFGKSSLSEEEQERDVAILRAAIKWLKDGDKEPAKLGEKTVLGGFGTAFAVEFDNDVEDNEQRVSRSVYYQASW